MVIEESHIEYNGYYNENVALACLLAADVCFLNMVDISKLHPQFYKHPTWTTCVYVNCNDTFAYASADGECITNSDGDPDSEIVALYKMWKENSLYGPIKWCALKRNMRPLKEHIQAMKKANYWDDKLEALPK